MAIEHRAHDIHAQSTSNANPPVTTVTSTFNSGVVVVTTTTNTHSIGNSNISADRSSSHDDNDDNSEGDEEEEEEEESDGDGEHDDDSEKTQPVETSRDMLRNSRETKKVFISEKLNSTTTTDNIHKDGGIKCPTYDEQDLKSGADYEKLDSVKKSKTLTTNNPTNSTKQSATVLYKAENDGSLENAKDASMRNLAKRTLTIGIPGLRSSSHKTLFIFSEENAIRKYSKIIIEWGYPFFSKSHNIIINN
ncbi:unnamed protein product [Trichobilharzia szidati]|nr:unnamed protein product [Trichobilharzia szidati]